MEKKRSAGSLAGQKRGKSTSGAEHQETRTTTNVAAERRTPHDTRPLFDDLFISQALTDASHPAFKAAVLIQRWYRRYMARLEMRRRCTWRIFQSIEYSGQQDHLKLNHFFDYLMEKFTPSNSKERDFINRMFSESEVTVEKYLPYETVAVPFGYVGPRLSFPLLPDHATALLEAYKHEKQLHAHYVLRLLYEARNHLVQLPNITSISTCYSEEITICGDLHGQLNDLFLIFYKVSVGLSRDNCSGSGISAMFPHDGAKKRLSTGYKNGLPSPQKAYVFNGDFVDRGKHSIEILIVLLVFLLIYPKEVHLNRGNHEDYMVNLRYGLTKEVMRKYKEHGSKILKLLRSVFSCLPLATLIDQKVLIVHGGVSDKTDLEQLAKIDRRKVLSVLAQRKPSRTLIPAEVTDSRLSRAAVSQRAQQSAEGEPSTSYASVSARSEASDFEDYELQQILDILWSDPVPRLGCCLNEERGGGCCFGPDVTDKILQKHGLQLIIRSHECKPEGYEFSHNRKVLTIFSASNYYAPGSNRGAYIKLGPDLIPQLVQYQAGKGAQKLTMTQRISRVEESAYQALREKLFAHESDLRKAFKKFDKTNSGLITLSDWAKAMESVLPLGLPWRMLRPQMVSRLSGGKVNYKLWLKDIALEHRSTTQERVQSSLLETIYQNLSNLETVFNIIDSDHSGVISLEEFRQTWILFGAHMNIEMSDDNIGNLARCIDFNKDGNIDFNEFLEAFRLTTQSPS